MVDAQQELVYEWEADFRDFNRQTFTLEECRKFIHTATGRYGTPPPRVRSHRPRGGITFYQADQIPRREKDILAIHQRIRGSAVISFRKDGKNPAVALHEASHAILNYWLPLGGYEDHGPEFLGIYFWLLLRANILPEAALIASARTAGLKWMKNFTPGRFHRWRHRMQSKQLIKVGSPT